MVDILFDGQQGDERILSILTPHVLSKYIAIGTTILLALFFLLMTFLIATIAPGLSIFFQTGGILLSVMLALGGFWWNTIVYEKSKTYITDRRIIRFVVVSPFFMTKRALFWNEALKAKAYAPHLLYRLLKIGTIQVEPIVSDHENVIVENAYYFEDIANYIDKILFTFKNKPQDIESLKPFVPKPKGQRDEVTHG